MACQTDSHFRARRILTISHTPRFLLLPREVRDIIYSETLIEHILWLKRHKDGCPFYNPDAWSEITPAMLLHPRERRALFAAWDADKQQQCTAICVRRRGLGLLGVNRQIRDEASTVFWGNNTFCFYNIDPYLELLTLDSRSHRPLVERISIRKYGVIPSHNTLRNLYYALAELENLKHLEIDPAYLPLQMKHLFNLPNLKTVRLVSRCYVTMTIRVNPYWQEETPLWAGISSDYVLPDSSPNTHSEGVVCPTGETRGPRIWCRKCRDLYDKMMGWGEAWTRRWPLLEERVECYERAEYLLSQKQHQHSAEPEHKIDVRLSNGRQETVAVWGLPVDPQEVRERRVLAEIRPQPSPKRRPIQTEVPLNHDDDTSVLLGRRNLQSRHPVLQDIQDKEATLQQRRERREENAKAEAKAERKQRRKQAASRSRSEKQLKIDKEKARKRSPSFAMPLPSRSKGS